MRGPKLCGAQARPGARSRGGNLAQMSIVSPLTIHCLAICKCRHKGNQKTKSLMNFTLHSWQKNKVLELIFCYNSLTIQESITFSKRSHCHRNKLNRVCMQMIVNLRPGNQLHFLSETGIDAYRAFPNAPFCSAD